MCWPRPSLLSRPSSPLLRESSRMTSLTWRHTLRVESVPRQFVVRPRLKCAIVVSLYLLFEACLYSVLCALYSPCSLQSCTSISSSLSSHAARQRFAKMCKFCCYQSQLVQATRLSKYFWWWSSPRSANFVQTVLCQIFATYFSLNFLYFVKRTVLQLTDDFCL